MKRIILFSLLLVAALTSSAQIQTIENGESGLSVRNKINDNFAYVDTAGVQRLDSLLTAGVMSYDTVGVIKDAAAGVVNALRTNNDVKGVGMITVTNGSAIVTGVGTNFLDATQVGVSYWWNMWVKDSAGVWHRFSLNSIDNATQVTIFRAWTEAQWTTYTNSVATSFPNSLGTATFSGVSGTYEFWIVKNFSKGPFTNSFGNNSYVGGDGYGTVFGGRNVLLSTGGTIFGTDIMMHADADRAFASGWQNVVRGANSFTMGTGNLNEGLNAMALGYRAIVQAEGAFSGGLGTTGGNLWVATNGRGAFTYSHAATKPVTNSGPNAAILGGQDHTIPSTSPRSVILGGNNITVAASTPDVVHMPKLRIGLGTGGSLTTDNTNTSLLTRDATTGEVELTETTSLPFWSTGATTSLTGTTTITGNGSTISIQSDDAGDRGKMAVGSAVSQLLKYHPTLGGASHLSLADGQTILQYDSDTGSDKTMTMNNTQWLIDDDVNSKGLEYSADYSANFTNRSLIDKGYAFSSFVANAGGTSIGSVGLSAVNDASYWDWELASSTGPVAKMTIGQNDLSSQWGITLMSFDNNIETTAAPMLRAIPGKVYLGLMDVYTNVGTQYFEFYSSISDGLQYIKVHGLPTTSPCATHGSNTLWNDGGALKICP